MKATQRPTQRVLLVGVVMAMGLCAGIAWGTIPDSTGVIHSCYSQATGTWRPIDTQAGQKCKSGETALNWNQQGPTGPAGAPGPAGQPGSAGQPGPAGTDGTSVSSTPLPQGDANCPTGGSRFDSVSGTTYACNGAPEAINYYQSGVAGTLQYLNAVGYTNVATLVLPRGSYLVEGAFQLEESPTACWIVRPDVSFPDGYATLATFQSPSSVSFRLAVVLAADNQVILQCQGTGLPYNRAQLFDFTALTLGNVITE